MIGTDDSRKIQVVELLNKITNNPNEGMDLLYCVHTFLFHNYKISYDDILGSNHKRRDIG